MKYAKYILIVVALYFGIKYHNEYLKTKKEIQSIEDAYKDEKTRKFKEYQINSENIKFQHDSVNLSLDQKYLELTHHIHIQYLQGKFDEETYGDKLQELKKSESEEVLANIKSWLKKKNGNIWPKTPIPDLLIEKRKTSEGRSNASYFVSGVLLFFFLLSDVLSWLKDRRQKQNPIQVNQQGTSLKEKESNQMIYEVDGKKVILERQKATNEEGDVFDSWIDEMGYPVEVPEEITAAWDKQQQGNPNVNPNVVTNT